MINAQLSDLTAATTLAGGELIYVVQGGNSRRSTLGAIGAQLMGDTGQTAALTTLGGVDGLRDYLDVAPYVSTRTALKAVDTTKNALVYLTETGREGMFKWTTGDFATEIAADTSEGIYAKADGIASTVGAWVRVYNGFVHVEWFGAISYTSAELVALNGSVGTVPADNTTAFQAAFDIVETIGGGTVAALGHIYVHGTTGIEGPSGATLALNVAGGWDVVFHNIDKSWTGTTLLFKGTGTDSESFRGITSMAVAGGWREDPDNAGTYFKLTTFMNTDASGATRATPRTFSAAIRGKTNQTDNPFRIVGGRVCPWIGTDGISEYSNEATAEVADDWDVGVLINDQDYVELDHVQVVGYWKLAGAAIVSPGQDAYGQLERCRFTACKFQGRAGVLLRHNDVHEVESATTTTVVIPWTSEHFWPTTGDFEATGGTDYTYTGLTYAATGGGQLTFTGVSPDPSSITQIRSVRRGTGSAGMVFRDCMIHGFDHVSGGTYQTAVGGTDPSRALEMSGFPLRGVAFYNTKIQTDEDVVLFFHDAEDTQFFGGQAEAGGRGYVIGSPAQANSTADHPAGETADIFMSGFRFSSCDETLWSVRGLYDSMLQFNKELRDKNTLVKPRTSADHVVIENGAGDQVFTTQAKTFTPAFSFGTGITYTNQTGTYQRLGNRVIFEVSITWSAMDVTTDASAVQIAFPVAPSAADTHVEGGVNTRLSTGIDLSTTGFVQLDTISTTLLCMVNSSGGRLVYNGGEMQASGRLFISGWYKI